MLRRRPVLVSLLVLLAGAGGLVGATAQAGPEQAPDRWALIVGLDHFLGATRPNTGSVGDANDLKDALLRNGWPADHIRVLTDGDADAAEIRDGLSWLASHSGPNTFSVFHYSGHVKQRGTTEYLWPHDNSFISDHELAGYLHQVSGWLWADISGCEAAGFFEGENLAGPQHLLTASSQANEKSYELPAASANSVFMHLLADEGMLQGQADANHDGHASITEAFAYAAQRAPQMTAGQSHGPQHPWIAGGDGGEWPLGAPATSAPTARKCLLVCLPR